MLQLNEFKASLLCHDLVPAGPIPTACDPNGIYPYQSFSETSQRSSLKSFRFVSLENDFIRAVICPDLGGRVQSLVHKASGKDALYLPPSVRPARILPRQAFLSGGIEMSFPVSHTPSQIEPVLCSTKVLKDRTYLWCGERELRFGMHWTVEYSLGIKDAFLTQRSSFHNPTRQAHPWMSWSNAAVPALPDTEFHFPSGPVLTHSTTLGVKDWKTQGPRRQRDIDRMTGYFWQEPEFCAFGAYTPSLGSGLYHVADPALCPGIKLWSYGLRDAAWAADKQPYLEIQAGPLKDQSLKAELAPGERHWHQEFWLPTDRALDPASLKPPTVKLLPLAKVPRFGWARPADAQVWEKLLKAYKAKKASVLPDPPAEDDNRWAPSGMDLGPALTWAAAKDRKRASLWFFQLGAWQAGCGDVAAAKLSLGRSGDGRAQALVARLHLLDKDQDRATACWLAVSGALALHPQVVVERDKALALLGATAFEERRAWLDKIAGLEDEWISERRASLLADEGEFLEAKAVLEKTKFQRVHQVYSRTALWKRIQTGLGLPASEVPEFLGEDSLAEFGAYREFRT